VLPQNTTPVAHVTQQPQKSKEGKHLVRITHKRCFKGCNTLRDAKFGYTMNRQQQVILATSKEQGRLGLGKDYRKKMPLRLNTSCKAPKSRHLENPSTFAIPPFAVSQAPIPSTNQSLFGFIYLQSGIQPTITSGDQSTNGKPSIRQKLPYHRVGAPRGHVKAYISSTIPANM
jgi:hypothetical protein